MRTTLFERTLPPTDSATDPKTVVQSAVTGLAAANVDLWGGLAEADRPPGKVYVTFDALTQDCYVRFKSTNSAAGTTSANGQLIKAGAAPHITYYLDPSKHVYMDVIAPGGAGTVKWQVVSHPQETFKAFGT